MLRAAQRNELVISGENIKSPAYKRELSSVSFDKTKGSDEVFLATS